MSAAPKGLILSGLMGSGKSSLERRLVTDYGFRHPRNVVTRAVDLSEDPNYESINEPDFIVGAREGALVFAYRFGKTWYAYRRDEWQQILAADGQGWVFNVRPYVGLLLRSLLASTEAVWLDVDEETRLARVHKRDAPKDTDPERAHQDYLELQYRQLYVNMLDSSDSDQCLSQALMLANSAGPGLQG